MLNEYESSANWQKVREEIARLNDIKTELQTLQYVPNGLKEAEIYGYKDVVGVNTAVTKKLESLYNHVGDTDLTLISDQNLQYLQKKLEFEIKFVENPGQYKPGASQYVTWELSQNAYKKELIKVQNEIKARKYLSDISDLASQYASVKNKFTATPNWSDIQFAVAQGDFTLADNLISAAQKDNIINGLYNSYKIEKLHYASQSSAFKQTEASFLDALKKGNTTTAQYYLDDMRTIVASKKTRKKRTAADVVFGDKCFTQERKNNAKYFLDKNDGNDYFHQYAVDFWSKSNVNEKVAAYGYTAGSSYLTEPLRAIQGHYYYFSSELQRTIRDCENLTTALNKVSLKDDVWIKRDDDMWCLRYIFNTDFTTVKKAATRNHEINKELRRLNQALKTSTDKKLITDQINILIKEQDSLSDLKNLYGKTGVDESFQSTGISKDAVFRRKDCIVNIYAPKGTHGTYCEPFSAYGNNAGGPHSHWDGKTKASGWLNEVEFLLQRGTQFRLTKIEYDPVLDKWYFDVEIIGQRQPKLKAVQTSSGYYFDRLP